MRHIARVLVAVISFAAFSTQAQQAEPECKIDPDWKQSKITETLEACKQQAQSATPEAVVQNVSAYAEVAKGVAEAIGIAAREVGVAVDEFVKTDAGKMTIALIVWHVAGDDLKGIVFGIPIILFAVWLWFAVTGRIKRTGEYITVKGRFGNEKSIPKLKQMSDFEDGENFAYFMTCIFCAALIVAGVVHVL